MDVICPDSTTETYFSYNLMRAIYGLLSVLFSFVERTDSRLKFDLERIENEYTIFMHQGLAL